MAFLHCLTLAMPRPIPDELSEADGAYVKRRIDVSISSFMSCSSLDIDLGLYKSSGIYLVRGGKGCPYIVGHGTKVQSLLYLYCTQPALDLVMVATHLLCQWYSSSALMCVMMECNWCARYQVIGMSIQLTAGLKG